MSKRLVIALALGVLAAVLGAGAVGAQTNGVTVDVPGVGQVGTNGVLACANGADDDGDGLQDMSDPGCASPADGDESNAAPTAPPSTTTPTTPMPYLTKPVTPDRKDEPNAT